MALITRTRPLSTDLAAPLTPWSHTIAVRDMYTAAWERSYSIAELSAVIGWPISSIRKQIERNVFPIDWFRLGYYFRFAKHDVHAYLMAPVERQEYQDAILADDSIRD